MKIPDRKCLCTGEIKNKFAAGSFGPSQIFSGPIEFSCAKLEAGVLGVGKLFEI